MTIAKLRKKNGWSQEVFARKMGVSRQSVVYWELGSSIPNGKNLLKMAKVFDVPAETIELIGGRSKDDTIRD